MIKLELISRKRNPIKRNAFIGIGLAFFILMLIATTGHFIGNTVKTVLMVLVAAIFIICLFIINYSYKFKKVIGSIAFLNDKIEIDLLQQKELIHVDKVKNIKFKLSGYEGLNKSTIFENVFFPVTRLSYHGGINNFIYIISGGKTRRFEFYIPDKRAWAEIQALAKHYHEKISI